MPADATYVPTIKLHPGAPSTNGDAFRELDENLVVTRVGGAIAEAASDMRKSDGEDAREAARRAAVDIATAALVANSSETAAHSDDVDVITEGIARRLGISGQQLEDVLIAARLHDIGKLGVPVRILNKPDSLNPIEWTAIHRHTIVGEQILLAVPELRGAPRLVAIPTSAGTVWATRTDSRVRRSRSAAGSSSAPTLFTRSAPTARTGEDARRPRPLPRSEPTQAPSSTPRSSRPW